MGNNTDGNEVERRDILWSALPAHLLLVLGLVFTVIFVVDKVEPGVLVSKDTSRLVGRERTWGRPLQTTTKGKYRFRGVRWTDSRNLS